MKTCGLPRINNIMRNLNATSENSPKRGSPRRSPLWKYFLRSALDPAVVECRLCSKAIRRGKVGGSLSTMNSGMHLHMRGSHTQEWRVLAGVMGWKGEVREEEEEEQQDQVEEEEEAGVWRYYERDPMEPSRAACQVGECSAVVVREEAAMLDHLARHGYKAAF